MAFNDSPNKLESAFIQRNAANTYNELLNISGSDLIIYHSSSGELTADKISVWATKYNIGTSASFAAHALSASYAPSAPSISASYALTASFALNGGGGSSITTQSLYSTQSAYSTQSLYSTQSISASYATSASFAITASFAYGGIGASTGSLAFTASVGMYSLDTNIPTFVPFFSAGGHMSASKISVTNGGTTKVNAASLIAPPMENIFYIGRDGNVNTWAAQGFYNDAGGLNAKYWMNYANQSNTLEWAAANDDFSLFTPWLTVTRSGSAITNIQFQKDVTFAGNIFPATNLTNSIGSGSLQWKFGYIQTLFGTASWATQSLFSTQSLFATQSLFSTRSIFSTSASWASSSISASVVTSASYTISASYAPSAPSVSASYATSASWADNAGTASLLLGNVQNATQAVSASWASSSLSSSVAVSASNALTASYALNASGNSGTQSLYATNSLFASSSAYSTQSLFSTQSRFATQSLYSTQSTYATQSVYATSASWASSSISASFSTTASFAILAGQAVSASYAPVSGVVTNAETASLAYTASTAISASYATSASWSDQSGTASVLLGSVVSSSYALSSSFASSSISSSYSKTASFVALSQLSNTSSYPWSSSAAGNPYHNTAAVGIGTLNPPASRLSILEPTTNSGVIPIVSVYGNRTDSIPTQLIVRNLDQSSANAYAAVTVGLGIGNETGHMYVARAATPAFGIVNGLNFSPSGSGQDIGFRTGVALSGSVSGPTLQIKSNGLVGIGVATPTNARLHIGGSEVTYYNATIRLTNGNAGGADVFFAATDNNWGFPAANKLIIGTGDPSNTSSLIQINASTGWIGMGVPIGDIPLAQLHVNGNITASSVTASFFAGTASWANNALTASYIQSSSYAGTASVLLGSVVSSSYALSSSISFQSNTSSYAVSASLTVTSSNANTASLAFNAISASYAPSAPSISASYAVSASWAPGAAAASSRVVTLCAAFTPYLTGPDAAEIPIPYLSDGISPVSWSVNRLNFRVQLSGSTTSSVIIQKSSSTGSFSPVSLCTMSLNSSSYESYTSSISTIISGDKIRFCVNTIGTAQFWTLTTEITSL